MTPAGARRATPSAEEIRDRCLRAAIEAWEEAGISGLCAEGRWECVVAAIRRVELTAADPDRGGS